MLSQYLPAANASTSAKMDASTLGESTLYRLGEQAERKYAEERDISRKDADETKDVTIGRALEDMETQDPNEETGEGVKSE